MPRHLRSRSARPRSVFVVGRGQTRQNEHVRNECLVGNCTMPALTATTPCDASPLTLAKRPPEIGFRCRKGPNEAKRTRQKRMFGGQLYHARINRDYPVRCLATYAREAPARDRFSLSEGAKRGKTNTSETNVWWAIVPCPH